MRAAPGRGGVSAARAVSRAYLAGTPPAPPLLGCRRRGRSSGWASRGRAARGAPGPSWGGMAGASLGTFSEVLHAGWKAI